MGDTNGSDDGGVSISRRDALRAWGAAAALGVSGATLPDVSAAYQGGVSINEIWQSFLDRFPDNWGKWGANDELGTLNYLGGREAFRGMQAALQGPKNDIEVFTLQLPYTAVVIESDDPSEPGDPVFPTREPGRRDSVVDDRHYKEGIVDPLVGGGRFSDDAFITRLFLQGSTQYDAVAHFWYNTKKRLGQDELADEREELLYNGYPASTLSTPQEFDRAIDGLRPASDPDNDPTTDPGPAASEGPFNTDLEAVDVTRTFEAAKNGVNNQAEHGTVGRGVLIDVGRNTDLPTDDEDRLLPGTCVRFEDIQTALDRQGVEFRKRDIPLFRTGSIDRARDPDAGWTTNEPGLCFTEELLEWFVEMEVPMIAGDNLAVEKLTVEIDPTEDLFDETREAVEDDLNITLDEPFDIVNPLHPALLVNLGMPICEIFYFEELAAACEEDGVYTCLYAGAPLKVIGGYGAPANPVAIKASGGGNRGRDDDEEDDDEEEEEMDDGDGRGGRGRGGDSPAGGPRGPGGGDGDRPWWWDGDDEDDD